MTQATPLLVGRESELTDLLEDVRRAGDGGSRLVVVSGEPGAGRTALLVELARRVRATQPTASLVHVSAVDWEARRPHALLALVAPAVEDPWSADPFEAATALLEAAAPADGALVVLVDDAQHSDPDSLQALATAVRHHRDTALVVVLAHSTPARGVPGPVGDLLARVADRVVRLTGLGAGEVAELAAGVGHPLRPGVAAHLTRHTGGIPAHVVGLLGSLPRDAWEDSVARLPAPPTVTLDVRRALAACGPLTTGLVEAVAVLGVRASVRAASAVAGLDDTADSTVDAVDEAERAGLLTMRDRSDSLVLDLPDAMVRAAVLHEMGASRRAALHRRAAEVVEDRAAALAHAVEASPLPDPDLADQLDALAVQRGSRGEWASAAELLGLASRVTADPRLRDDRLVRSVDAMVGDGDISSASSYIAQIESFRETTMRNAVLGYLAILRGRPQEAEALLMRAWQLVSTRREPDVAALICQRQVLHHLSRCDGAGVVQWADLAVELVGADQPTAVEAQAIRGLGLGGTGRRAEALESYRELWGHASRGAVGQRVQMGAGWLHLASDEVDLARGELETAVPTDFLGGSTRISLWARAWLARTHFVTGDWDAALRTVRSASDLADRSGITLIVPLLQWTAAQVHALRGDWEEAERSLQLGEASARDYEIMRVPACLARAGVAEARADYAAVIRALSPLTEPWGHGDIDEPGFWPWPDVYANALVLEGRLDEADAFLAPHEERAVDRGHRSAQARLGYARGRWHGARGDLPAARRSFEASLALLNGLPLVHDRARVNFSYGQTLRRAGKRREADVAISAALDAYRSIGATTYVRRCERELRAGGVRAVVKDRPVDALTPQEHAVAGLVSTGLTNREVAAELFLSVKTVQFHLTRVYAKLGVRSRSELAAARAAHPLEEDA